jgi:hypothetical protein
MSIRARRAFAEAVKSAPLKRRNRADDETLLFIIRAFTTLDHTQKIVDEIRARGYQASFPRVNALIDKYDPLNSPGGKKLSVVKAAVVHQIPTLLNLKEQDNG